MASEVIEAREALEGLTLRRLLEIGQGLGVPMLLGGTKARQVNRLAGHAALGSVFGAMSRDELREACRRNGLDDGGRARVELVRRLLAAVRGGGAALEALGEAEAQERDPFTPQVGDIAVVRQRQWLVESVCREGEPRIMTRAGLSCLDDDAAGRPLEVLWELELGARIVEPRRQGLGQVDGVDEARRFAAFYHALKWGGVTATDPDRFQAPLRAGIQVWPHQIVPLRKALMLPRANLFIADDVGLGKTIEAGLILSELLLRQRIDFAMIVCPASVALQWQEEMASRFGLHFEVMSRDLVLQRKQERGFGVNVWATHNRFIASYSTLRRPEYREPLERMLGARIRKSMLILDEAHTVAPASASRYAVDSQLTGLARSLTPRFDNRLFLSATPHNGHSNSFSALLELLDPQRFTRGVPVRGVEALEAVMVRRLKGDLGKTLTVQSFPKRRVIELELCWQDGRWRQRALEGEEVLEEIDLGPDEPVELRLSEMLARYTALRAPASERGRLVFINLQKRLLSSVEAFYRTLSAHARGAVDDPGDDPGGGDDQAEGVQRELIDAEVHGDSEDAAEQHSRWEMARDSRALARPSTTAAELLAEMLEIAGRWRQARDAKVKALLAWVRAHQCPGAGLPPDQHKPGDGAWTGRRLIIFTEYGHTLKALRTLLANAFEGTERADERVACFTGGLGEDARARLRRDFNAPPAQSPVRILLATDAAREGVNLQAHCADLIHFDLPWNPSRIEQRNGRIDRTLQPSPEVRCMVFHYPQRAEDRVLKILVRKIERIQAELGSLGAVLLDRMAEALEEAGIDEGAAARVEAAADASGPGREVVAQELEAARDLQTLKRDLDEAAALMARSREVMDFRPEMLREVLQVGLELAGVGPMTPTSVPTSAGAPPIKAWRLPPMPQGWSQSLDALRPPRERDEPPWQWRLRPPRPVVFEAPSIMTEALVHLHLEHPFIQRALSPFGATHRGASSPGGLHRVTILPHPEASQPFALAVARLSIFGHGATRLHDTLLHAAALWRQAGGVSDDELPDDQEVKLIERLPDLMRGAHAHPIPEALRRELQRGAAADFARLWPALEAEADTLAQEAQGALTQRGDAEAQALTLILQRQRDAIDAAIGHQTSLFYAMTDLPAPERRQWHLDRDHMEARRLNIQQELIDEPRHLRDLYRVALRRVEPVGLIYLWPTTL